MIFSSKKFFLAREEGLLGLFSFCIYTASLLIVVCVGLIAFQAGKYFWPKESSVEIQVSSRAISYSTPLEKKAWPQKIYPCLKNFGNYLLEYPRASNTAGGVFPAILGTALLVFLMTIAVIPMGILVAIYLHEFGSYGYWTRFVRFTLNNLAGVPSIIFGMFGLVFFAYGLGGQMDRWFFSEHLPSATFGSGGLLWASLTLALLTLPVVAVATEEGLRSVSQKQRDNALALGATSFEVIWKIVLPGALPGIFTGMILAISRAAGEVAPLMLTGAVKLASAPIDGQFPFLHPERKFMHLGFHIYDAALQSPDAQASRPLVYAACFTLLLLVLLLNFTALYFRQSLRRKKPGAI